MMGMVRVLIRVPEEMVEPVRPGDDELEIVPVLFPEHIEGFLPAHERLDQLLPEDGVVIAGT